MAFNLTPQSSSAFQNDIINQIIAVINSIDTSGISDADFLNQAQSILFAGTFLPSGTTQMSWQPLNNSNNIWVLGGGQTSTAPAINLQVNSINVVTFSCQGSFSAPSGSFGSISAQSMTAQTMTVAGSPVITQSTLPTIPPAIATAFTLFTNTGNFSGTIGIVQFGFTLTMDMNFSVTTAFTGWSSLIPQTNAAISALCNRLRAGGMQTTATLLDQWIAGNNGNNDVRAICEMSSTNGLRIQGVTGGLNVGDSFNVMITWAVDSFA